MGYLETKVNIALDKMNEIKRRLHYKMSVSPTEHRKAVGLAERFSDDFASFIEQPGALKSLHLDCIQSRSLSTIIDEVKGKNMNYGRPITEYDGFPLLSLKYCNYDPATVMGKVETQLTTEDMAGNVLVLLGMDYNVKTSLPTEAFFWGFSHLNPGLFSDEVHFMFSKDPITNENIKDIIPESWLERTKVNANGRHVLLDWERPRIGEVVSTTYHLLGQVEFASKDIPLFVYGYNARMLSSSELSREAVGEVSYAED